MEYHTPEYGTRHQVSLDIMDMSITEIDQASAMSSGMEVVSGLIVKRVRWGGAADLAGVSSGDMISEVNGISVRKINDLKLILEAHTGEGPFRFLFRRVDAWRYLALSCETVQRSDRSQIDLKTDLFRA